MSTMTPPVPTRDLLSFWVIYESPRDYPSKFVLRRHFAGPNGEALVETACTVGDSLDAIRTLLPPGLLCMGRDPADDPHIAEVWL